MLAAHPPIRIFDRLKRTLGTHPVTAATGLKRLAIAVGAVVAAVVVALVALSFLIPAASVRDAVTKEIHAVTGLDPMLRGDMSVSLFPSGTVTFHDVVLGDDGNGEPAMIADELTAHLRYFPLLAGRIEIADVTLVRPTITVTLPARRRIELVGTDPIAGAGAAARSRPKRLVLGNRHPGRHRHHSQDLRRQGRHRPARRRGFPACLAVDLAQLRRQRPLRLARRADRGELSRSAIFSPR